METWQIVVILAVTIVVVGVIAGVVIYFVLVDGVACETSTVSLCYDHVDYNSTVFPNDFASSQSSAASSISSYEDLLACHNQSLYFACNLYTPECINDGEYRLPCRSLCQEVLAVCIASIDGLVFDINCDDLPDDYRSSVCAGGTEPLEFDGNCNSDEFECDNGECIASKYRCDETYDCLDDSDEDGCSCPDYRFIECSSGSTCISPFYVCDNEYDCDDYSDELYCDASNTPMCSQMSSLYTTCGDYGCIYKSWLCDGIVDCPDLYDEAGCDPCGGDFFGCTDGSKCIPDIWHCDGYPDCTDQSDEDSCPAATCAADKFTCDNDVCIPLSWVCEGTDDCGDNSDEAVTLCDVCTDNGQFRCNDGSCIALSKHCDNSDDCGDNSDESGCACTSDQFTCDNDNCVSLTLQCDGNDDCTDNSDETVCECGTVTVALSRIVGGLDSELGQWPWQVSLQWPDSGHFCGGTLVHPQWVVTAAHCTIDEVASGIEVHMGITMHAEWAQTDTRVIKGVNRIINHESYNTLTSDYDIALLELESPVHLSDNIRLACLPSSDMDFPAGKDCFISGWGLTEEAGNVPDLLQDARVPVTSISDCAVPLTSITTRMICAGFPEGGVDSCQGDSGGPMVCYMDDNKWYLAGAVSWGIGCARRRKPGVYARVTYFRDWIDDNLNT